LVAKTYNKHIQNIPGLKKSILQHIIPSQKCDAHTDPNHNIYTAMSKMKYKRQKHMVYILILAVKRTGTVNIGHYSHKLFRVAFICLDIFSEPGNV
jgi:hypothetical protein